jgi:ABC-type transport system involved in Fe-S cluster assembly fused permease/ATPase subunit
MAITADPVLIGSILGLLRIGWDGLPSYRSGRFRFLDLALQYHQSHLRAGDLIVLLPQGPTTQCRSLGAMFSGGQRPHIAIARASLRNPRIFRLNGPPSVFGTYNEHAAHEALNATTKSGGQTTIVVGRPIQYHSICRT